MHALTSLQLSPTTSFGFPAQCAPFSSSKISINRGCPAILSEKRVPGIHFFDGRFPAFLILELFLVAASWLLRELDSK